MLLRSLTSVHILVDPHELAVFLNSLTSNLDQVRHGHLSVQAVLVFLVVQQDIRLDKMLGIGDPDLIRFLKFFY